MPPDASPRAADSSPASEPLDPLLGTTLAERYRIEACVGKGGMGTVYRATHIHMRKTLAIKVLLPEMAENDEVVARFEREAIAAGRITHEHVVSATDFGRAPNGSFYLVMEHVPGATLSAVLAKGPMGTERALHVARQIALALEAAHALGIVHRDLKPDNVILLEKNGASDFVKVLDFGIARFTAPETKPSQDLTQVGAVFGTPQYMAPEQAAGKVVDHRADLYALGVILFEILSGRPPFQHDTVPGLLVQQLTEAPPPLPEGTDPDVDCLVRALLDKQADTRIQSAAQVIEAIDAIASGISSPVLAERAHTKPAPAPTAALAKPTAKPRRARRSWVWAFGAAAASLGFLVAWRTASSNVVSAAASADAPQRTSAPATAAIAAPRGAPRSPVASRPVEPTATPAVSASASAAAASGSSSARASAASARPQQPVRTTAKTSSTKRSSTKTKASTSKRRTGPGGIYIPPPSTWFD